jgi:hypothetical protein
VIKNENIFSKSYIMSSTHDKNNKPHSPVKFICPVETPAKITFSHLADSGESHEAFYLHLPIPTHPKECAKK